MNKVLLRAYINASMDLAGEWIMEIEGTEAGKRLKARRERLIATVEARLNQKLELLFMLETLRIKAIAFMNVNEAPDVSADAYTLAHNELATALMAVNLFYLERQLQHPR